MLNKSFLNLILSTDSPDGFEQENASIVFKQYCEKFSKLEFFDTMGNVAMSVGDGSIPFMVSAHIDEIGLKVQYIDDNGFIYFIKNGGIDRKVLLGSTVKILSSKTAVPLYGVIGKKPIHIEHNTDDMNKVTDIKDMKIDCGFESKEEALKCLSIGDNITILGFQKELGLNRISGKGLDDKVGVFVVASVLEELSNKKLNNIKVFGVATTQEETGGHGAIRVAKAINPIISIDYDVTFATDDSYVSPKEWGDLKLGKGGAICYSPDCDSNLSSALKETCEKNSIPYQEFSKPNGMTNTTKIMDSSSAARTLLLSIPLRNMHTQVEVCDFRDLKSLVDMTVASIITMDEIISTNNKKEKIKNEKD